MSTAFSAELQYASVEFQPAALDIWQQKYQLKAKDGTPIDQSMDGSFQRVAKALAEIEKPDSQKHWYEQFLWALRHGAIPAGRVMSNAGAQAYKPATSTINCTVSGTIRDSMDDILGKAHEAGLTLKSGAGIGYEFSTLRPRGAFVSGAGAHTSGPLSFMDIYDKMCFTVSSAGGRRGAQMGTFDIGHPDVLEFIRAKRENGRLRQFNLSLLITDEFIEAVRSDGQWRLAFPLSVKEADLDKPDLSDSSKYVWREWPVKDGYVTREDGLVCCKVYKTLPARRIWDVIMSSTYDYAEPGFILIDRSNQMNNNWWCENIRASNPCVTAETWVHTDQGPRQVSALLGKQFNVRVNGRDHATGADGFFRTGKKSIVKIVTKEGYSLQLTPDHKVKRITQLHAVGNQSEWCAAKDLACGDKLVINDHRCSPHWAGALSFDEGYLIGHLIGDGHLTAKTANLCIWQQDKAAVVNEMNSNDLNVVRSLISEAAKNVFSLSETHAGWCKINGQNKDGSSVEYRFQSVELKRLAEQLGLSIYDKTITPSMESASSEFYKGLLRGLFDTDGSVQGSQENGLSARLVQSNIAILEAAQRMLLRLGIANRIYERRETGSTLLPDGKVDLKVYEIKSQYELVISRDNLFVFVDQVGFTDPLKLSRVKDYLSKYKRSPNRERFFATVSRIVSDGEADVFDVQVPGINAFDANGIYAHNCGEQMLPPYGSCLLGSVNLTRFVDNPFTEEAVFDWDEYREVVEVFTRMLDNVVEINGLPLEGQRREIERKRRHGMGFLGLGSALAMLRIKYGSPESVRFTERVSREMALAGWQTALQLAHEKGPAPIMNEEFEVTADMLRKRPEMAADGIKLGDKVTGRVLHARYSRYMQRIAEVDPELVKELAAVGARFTHHTSIAPTGTIALSFANNVSNGIEPSFAHHYYRNVIKEGKKSKERVDVYSYELLSYRTFVNPQAMPGAEDKANQLPSYFTSSEEVTPKQHVDIQAAAQRWVDSSISKTANVPTDFPFEKFKDIYLYAHSQGLKGCTTFRYNPEVFQGVLVKSDDLKNTFYVFKLEDGSEVKLRGDEQVEYDGEVHTAANLYDALKEGYFGRY